MRVSSTSLSAAIAALIAVTPSGAFADRAHFYIGAEAGYTNYSYDDTNVFGEDAANAGAFIGVRNKHFGAELGFNQTADAEKDSVIGVIPVSTETSLQTISIDALGFLPLNDRGTEVFGGVGYAYANADVEASAGALNISNDDDGDGFRLSAGLQQAVTPDVSLRGVYRHTMYGEGRLESRNDFNAGIVLNF